MRISPMIFAAVYAFFMPLAVGLFASWLVLGENWVLALKEWQTLVGGILAIGAALLGGLFVLFQTTQAKRQEYDRLARRHAAARAVMPLALSSLLDYARHVADELEGLRSLANGRGIVAPAGTVLSVPEVDPAVIEPLRDAIESASDQVADRIAQIISGVQVQDARMRDLRRTIAATGPSIFTLHNLDDYILHAATIYARGAALFEYARRQTTIAPTRFPTERELVTALNLLEFDDSTHSSLYEMAARRGQRYERLNAEDRED